MAHYAFIKDNLVTEVITGKDETETAPDGFADWEEYYLTKRPDQDACKRTSYNTNANAHGLGGTPFRGNYAGIGHTWDSTNEIFWPPQPYASWVKDIPSASWKSPIGDEPALTEEQISQNTARTHTWGYNWNEETQAWDLMDSGPVSV